MSDIESLQSTVEELKAQVAALTERVKALESGKRGARSPTGARGGARPRPKTAGAASGNSTRPKGPKRTGSARRKHSAMKRKPKSNHSEDKIDLPEERIVNYKVGKRTVYAVTPESYTPSAKDGTLPDAELKLEYIFGYNGKSCRNNLKYVENGSLVVYNIAGTGVVFNPATNEQKFFLGHNEDITSLAVHPSEPLVATGQLDPKGAETPYICVWNYKTLKEVARLGGAHDRAVPALAFSADGSLLFSVGADDSHTLVVWDWKKGKKLTEQMSSKADISGMAVNPSADEGHEFSTFGEKTAKLWTLKKDGGKWVLKSAMASAYKATKTTYKVYNACVYLADGRKVFAAKGGHLLVFRKDNKFQQLLEAHGDKTVGALVALPDGGFVSASAGSKSEGAKIIAWSTELEPTLTLDGGNIGAVRAIDTNESKLLIGTSRCAIHEMELADGASPTSLSSGHKNEIWALATHPSESVFATGAHDRVLRICDYTTHTQVKKKVIDGHNAKDAIRSCAYSPDGALLAVGFMSGFLSLLDANTLEVIFSKRMRKEQIDALAFSPNGQLLALGSWDQFVELIHVDMKEFVSIALKGHTSSITHLSFSDTSKYLMTNSRDYEILYWDTENGKRIDRSATADCKWHRWECILGWAFRGIWDGEMDGTDINACNVDGSESFIATGDDFGKVSLFRFPAIKPNSAKRSYPGHSAHVTNVRFSSSNDRLISTGGGDLSVFVWKLSG